MDDKKTRIINAALDEFYAKGFKNASTLAIAKKANVSKGLIFHYFGNKEKLYVYLVNYSLEIMVKDYLDKLEFKSNDLVDRLKEILVYKLKIMEENPSLIDFMTTAYYETDNESYKKLMEKRDQISIDVYQRLFKDIDYTVFREGVDVNEALKVLQWTFDGAAKEYINNLRATNSKIDPSDLEMIFNKYIKILSIGIYKEEKHD